MFDEEPEPTEAEIAEYRAQQAMVERICRAVCAVEEQDPDDIVYEYNSDSHGLVPTRPFWTRYAGAVMDAMAERRHGSTTSEHIETGERQYFDGDQWRAERRGCGCPGAIGPHDTDAAMAQRIRDAQEAERG